jgi:diaminopimelate decarboxylase
MIASGAGAPTTTLFLSAEKAAEVRERFGTPCYVYDRAMLEATARQLLALPAPYGLTVRYAMKANPSRGILTLFRDLGLHVDASSDWEVERALAAGFRGEQIQLTSQMPSRRIAEHLARGVILNACSLHQLDAIGRVAPGSAIAVRMNPGLGSGSTKRTNTGGPASSFGIWHEHLGEVKTIAALHGLVTRTVHSHIGSGTDAEVWKRATRMTLDLVAELSDATTVNLGGGFKVGRMPEEPTVHMDEVATHIAGELEAFRARDGRRLRVEIEPGTYLVARAGAVVATCVDVVDTGRQGYLFAKLDTGMNEVTRPSLYGAQHPVDVLAKDRQVAEVVFVGPCCESGDILTPAPGDPEALGPRWVPRPEIGDLVVVGGAGAYCAAMSTINYNSYPQAPEVMLEPDGTLTLVRRRQTFEQILMNEVMGGPDVAPQIPRRSEPSPTRRRSARSRST